VPGCGPAEEAGLTAPANYRFLPVGHERGREVATRYLRLSDGGALPELEALSPYKAVVVIEQNVSAQWQTKVARWLADSGCRYMIAWGTNCGSWHDSVDHANLEKFGFAEIPDDDFIMTTWHDDEPLQEVFWFAKITAHHPTLDLANVLFLHIGSADRQREFEDLYRNA
jgi:hypothetical protein